MKDGFEEILEGLRENTRTLKELSASIATHRREFVEESRASRAAFLREVDRLHGRGGGAAPSS